MRRIPPLPSRAFVVFFLTGLGLSLGSVEGQARLRPPAAARLQDDPPGASQASLRSRFALSQLEQGLNQRGEERQRHLERLATNGSRAAVEVITRWLDEDASSLNLREWLAVARALVSNTNHRGARDWLARIFGGAPVSDAEGDARLEELVRATAATGLARHGSKAALAKLGRALRQGSTLARLAQAALLAHPPRELSPILEAPGAPTSVYIETLELLGDQRAFMPLRSLVRRGTPEVASRAALALFRMGHLETVELAEHWLEAASEHDELLAAASEILLAVDSPAATRAVEMLLVRAPDQAVHLTHRLPSPKVSAPLDAHFDEFDVEAQRLILGTLAASGGETALRRVERALSSPQLELHAALALARAQDPSSERVLLAELDGERRGTATRALVIRGWLRDRRWSKLDEVLEEFTRSKAANERWLGWWGRSASSESSARQLLGSLDALQVAAAASTLLVHTDELALVAARRLNSETDSALLAALSTSLSMDVAAPAVATSTLERVAHADPALTLLTRPWLARRREPRLFWESAPPLDATIERAALAQLGANPAPEALGLLRRTYLESADERTRRAAIRGLSRRKASAPRDRLLRMAAQFDPDPGVRHLARVARSGAVQTSVRGRQVIWLNLGKAAGGSLALLTTDSGRALSARAAPDGQLVVLGFDDEYVQVRWSPPAP